jgi:hypothetical protein
MFHAVKTTDSVKNLNNVADNLILVALSGDTGARRDGSGSRIL